MNRLHTLSAPEIPAPAEEGFPRAILIDEITTQARHFMKIVGPKGSYSMMFFDHETGPGQQVNIREEGDVRSRLEVASDAVVQRTHACLFPKTSAAS